MILEPLLDILEPYFDDDVLVYENDDKLYYAKNFDKELLKDILEHNFQIYNGTYRHNYKKHTTDIYLNGRGRTCGKKIFRIQGFFPYCFVYSENGKSKTYLGDRVDKLVFLQEPKRVADLRRNQERIGTDIPCEADILFVRRFLIDMYDFFKPTEYVEPKICIFDVETNFPVNNNIISFAINGYDGYLYYNSLDLDDKYTLIIDLYDKLTQYDITTNWNVDFDISKLQIKLERIKRVLKPLDEGYELSKDDYIRMISVDYNMFGISTATQIMNALEEYEYIECNDIVKYGKKDFNVDIGFLVTPIDLRPITQKMYGREINGRWTLDNVGRQMCGIGKVDIDVKYPRDLKNEDLLEYNCRDVIIPEIIDNYLGGIECHIILAWSLQQQVNDMVITAAANDIALLRAYHKGGIVLPSRPPYKVNKNKATYKAAEPDARPGVYRNIIAYDLCISNDTRILTPNGWKGMDDIKIGDAIYSFNKDTKIIEDDRVSNLTKYHYKGKMINYIGIHINQLITPNHRVVYQYHHRDKRSPNYNTWSDYRVGLAKDIKINDRIPISSKMKYKDDYNISDEIIQLIGWVITEGWKSKDSKAVLLSQSNKKYIQVIKQLLDKSELTYSVYKRTRDNEHIFRIFARNDFRNKYFDNDDIHIIPQWILKNLSYRQLELLFKSMIDGDGHYKSKTSNPLRCYRRDNIYRFLHLCVLLGYTCSISKRVEDVNVIIPIDDGVHSENGRRHQKLYKNNIKEIDYDDDVWCPTTKNGFIIIERKGKVSITGNCAAYPSAVLAINASCETKDPNGKYKAPNGIRFNGNHSIFIDTLKSLMDDRNKIKASISTLQRDSPEWRKLKYIDFALKTQVAAFSHGIFGWENSRMYDVEVADAITATVRGILDVIKSECDKIGHSWVYCHTDSVYISAPKEQATIINTQLNEDIKGYCKSKGYSVIPHLDYKGFYPKGYIHSPARNVLIDENGEWHPTGVNYIRSEVPKPLRDIEVKLISMKIDGDTKDNMIPELQKMVLALKDIDSRELGVIKPLSKSVSKYGRLGKDGHKVGIPYHITALLRARDEYAFKIKVGEKFLVIPIIVDEWEGVRIKRRKRVYMAYPIEDGLPELYRIDFDNYLKSNLWGKINNICDMESRELRNAVLTPYIKNELGINGN